MLYDLVRERLPQWKQMRGLEVVSAIVAETLIELGVLIFTEPPEIHWPNSLVTKLPADPRSKKKGKNVQKHKHGIYGELVSSLAPSIPPQKDESASSVAKKGSKTAKFKTPAKAKPTFTAVSDYSVTNTMSEGAVRGAGDGAVDGLHQGLPVQGRRGQ